MYIYIYMYVCMYVCMYVFIDLREFLKSQLYTVTCYYIQQI